MKNLIKKLYYRKTAKFLLELSEKYPDHFKTGYCEFITRLYSKMCINDKEYFILYNFIRNNKPKEAIDAFWFERGDLQSRIEYLKNFIKL